MLTFASSAFAESEPNNSPSAANQLYMGNNYGKLSSLFDDDWWTYTTTPGNGRKVSITPPPGYHYYIKLYQKNSDGSLSYSMSSAGGYVYLWGNAVPTTYYIEVEFTGLKVDPNVDYTLYMTYL